MQNHLDLKINSSSATSSDNKKIIYKLNEAVGAGSEIDRIIAKIEQARINI